MKNKELGKYLSLKNFVISPWCLKVLKDKDIQIKELILIIYFFNLDNRIFDVLDIKEKLGFDEKQSLETFNSLIMKGLIKIVTEKDEKNRIKEIISLDSITELIEEDLIKNVSIATSESIYDVFEREFGRTLSPMEYEIINAWLDKKISEELILGALREAVYNGVTNLRYIDKIIYEWGKKGYKKMADVNKDLGQKKSNKELFDYNWLEDEK